MRDLYVLVTMDVEVPQQCPGASGPADWDFGAGAVQGYTELAASAGFPVSFFTHPECALKYERLLTDMQRRHGACIEGLHVHPWKFGDRKYRAHMGGLTADEQRQVISEAIAVWQTAFGRRPLFFRPGTFSANDSTFPVLVELGFRGGSVSAPGRVYRDLNAIWTGAVPDPHRPHRCFRQLEGDLPFANIPLTQDFSKLERIGERLYHRDLRPDYMDVDHLVLLGNITQQLAERQPAIPIIHFDTHNDHDYLNPADPVRKNYETVLSAIPRSCEQAGFRAVGATVEQVCNMVLERKVELPEFVPA